MSYAHKIRGIIFDLDGTLLTSSLDFNRMRREVGCPEGSDILGHVDSLPCDKARSSAHAVIRQHELTDAEHSEWIPGARSLVNSLAENLRPMAIVTRNIADAARTKMLRNKVPIDLVLSREDAPAKPDPTALLQIAAQWRLLPEQIMYVGDYLYDVQAANNAGMTSCLYAPGNIPDYADQADLVISDYPYLQRLLISEIEPEKVDISR